MNRIQEVLSKWNEFALVRRSKINNLKDQVKQLEQDKSTNILPITGISKKSYDQLKKERSILLGRIKKINLLLQSLPLDKQFFQLSKIDDELRKRLDVISIALMRIDIDKDSRLKLKGL